MAVRAWNCAVSIALLVKKMGDEGSGHETDQRGHQLPDLQRFISRFVAVDGGDGHGVDERKDRDRDDSRRPFVWFSLIVLPLQVPRPQANTAT
jgi:hypothetical protein